MLQIVGIDKKKTKRMIINTTTLQQARINDKLSTRKQTYNYLQQSQPNQANSYSNAKEEEEIYIQTIKPKETRTRGR